MHLPLLISAPVSLVLSPGALPLPLSREEGRSPRTSGLCGCMAGTERSRGRRELPLGLWEVPAGGLSLARSLCDQIRDPFIVSCALSYK